MAYVELKSRDKLGPGSRIKPRVDDRMKGPFPDAFAAVHEQEVEVVDQKTPAILKVKTGSGDEHTVMVGEVEILHEVKPTPPPASAAGGSARSKATAEERDEAEEKAEQDSLETFVVERTTDTVDAFEDMFR